MLYRATASASSLVPYYASHWKACQVRSFCNENNWLATTRRATGSVVSVSLLFRTHLLRKRKNLSNPKPGHTTGGSGRAAHSGAAGHGGPGRMGRRRVSPRRPQPSLVSSRALKTTVLNRRHEQRNPYVNRRRNKTRRWPAVYPRLISGTGSALCFWLLTSGPTPCLCKPFSCKACPGISIRRNRMRTSTSCNTKA